ncbi:methenyltetrahydrofolate cyclohydrolase /5,10-methylenetetrahydrofolate dehydrogenase (NADP+) [Acetitomaculum ruminis DSM 5522]|uniref:Bifunctional protein FolD n=1 Tax=Acetitomaculum ruminis DSM 5522 TaxID=1120918 RepID=A0A1I0UZH0_9FIRM|nr:bifunctional 5,10-methylenetetrahydrofolate dehydrogenase/5,10-methenyltetrahydrofolate cyclohydrolase [Acetitomaculum ruminis]SFA69283.1 methenyltetrahydrofolate cyclohydrolase /5,10-methylenetetrahydrofolate dehydrogenase (NADP+) [Acetitomaculum ruminis DSM 5522]
MSAKILDGKEVGQAIKDRCKKQVEELKAKGITPKLGIMRVGAKGPDLQYEKGAIKSMNECGVEVEVFEMPADITQEDYIKKMQEVNANKDIHGILAFRPLDNIDENKAINEVMSPEKDIDACTSINMGKMLLGDPTGLYPCTPSAVMEILDYYNIDVKGKDVCVIGNSNVVGKPVAVLLTNRFATIKVCHVYTTDTKEKCKNADIIVTACGVPNLVKAEQVKPGAIVIDVAICRVPDLDENGVQKTNPKTGKPAMKTVGDCAPDVMEVAGMQSPVPGGVGSVTSSILASNLIKACKIQNGIPLE